MVEWNRHDIWKTAAAFGAVCHKDVSSQVTHLVAAKVGLLSPIS